MNYLAHLLLSGPHSELALGNFLADMITPAQTEKLPEAVRSGISLHREIDRYTDQHETVRVSTARIRSNQRKYAPVSIDIYYDLLLVRNWDRYSTLGLDEMAESIYERLGDLLPVVPEPIQSRVHSMIDHRWLNTYRSAEGIRDVFHRMAKRASRPEIMESALSHLVLHDDDLNQDFNHFFPDIISYIQSIHPLGNEWLIPQNERKG